MLERAMAGLAALAMLVAVGCGGDPDSMRGTLLDAIAGMEEIVYDEISILEELSGRPDTRPRHEVWRQRLDEARETLDELAELRAEVDASTEAQLAGDAGRYLMSVVNEIRHATSERLQRLQAEFGSQRIT